MPFQMPWAKRRNQAMESQDGCSGAIAYTRKCSFLLKEFMQLAGRISQQRSFTSSDYAKSRVLLREHGRLKPPPAATEVHELIGQLFGDVKARIDTITSGPYQFRDVQEVVDEIIPQMDRITELYDAFVQACSPSS